MIATRWDRVPLPDAYFFQEGPGVRKWQFTSEGIKLLNVANIEKDGQLNLSKTDRHLSIDEVENRYTHFLLDEGDLVIASSGISFDVDGLLRTRGAFVSADHLPLCLNTSTIRFKAKEGVSDLAFLRHWINAYEFRQQITQRVTGSAQQNFGPTHLKSLKIALPPLSEQKRIAEILDRAEALRSARRAALALLDELTQSIFLDMFGDQTGEGRSIGQLLDEGALLLHKDGNHGSLYPRAEDFGEHGIPFVSAKAIDEQGDLDTELVEKLRTEKAEQLRIGWIEDGDVLLAHNASVGKVARYDGRFKRALIGTSLTAYRPNPAVLDSLYLAECLRSHGFQRQLAQNMGQTTRNQVPITAQRRLRIPVPNVELQNDFARRVALVNERKGDLRRSHKVLDELFSSVQQRAFRGEL
ncbi:MAG: restriction endonuclease subunit S [bacterium]|nr:restriction endonuclease subunit S [bacterium]